EQGGHRPCSPGPFCLSCPILRLAEHIPGGRAALGRDPQSAGVLPAEGWQRSVRGPHAQQSPGPPRPCPCPPTPSPSGPAPRSPPPGRAGAAVPPATSAGAAPKRQRAALARAAPCSEQLRVNYHVLRLLQAPRPSEDSPIMANAREEGSGAWWTGG